MSGTLFFPKSPQFIKSQADWLRKHFPHLKKHQADDTVASVLGWRNWHHANLALRKDNTVLSMPDDVMPPDVVAKRASQRIKAIAARTEIPSLEAYDFAMPWPITGQSGKIRKTSYRSLYDEVASLLPTRQADNGVPKAAVVPCQGNSNLSVLQIADGIVFCQADKAKCYVIDFHRFEELPRYFRFNSLAYEEACDAYAIIVHFCELFSRDQLRAAELHLQNEEPWHYEWQNGIKPANSKRISLSALTTYALEHPERWFALSLRIDRTGIDDVYYVPSLKGHAFANFLRNEGELPSGEIVWFKTTCKIAVLQLQVMEYPNFGEAQFNCIDEKRFSITEQIHISPFKVSPMASIEFSKIDLFAPLLPHSR